jgi:predicted alpha/beta-fold hydrolase
MNYVAPWWLPGGNLQTIWPALYARRSHGPRLEYRRERWLAPDGDFVDVDWLADAVGAESFDRLRTGPAETRPSTSSGRTDGEPLLVLFHGLEGSSRSHYAEAFADYAREHGMAFAVPHFRGCSGELNHAPRAYHSGDHEEIGWMLRRLREQHAGAIVAVGVSLGGNALLRWAAEAGDGAARSVSAVNARNDPFVPAWSLPGDREVGANVTLWQPAQGGHVGFPDGHLPGHVRRMPDEVGGWLRSAADLR